jgi:hypothetical protein
MVVVSNLPELPKQIQNHEGGGGCNMEKKNEVMVKIYVFTRRTWGVVSLTSLGSSKRKKTYTDLLITC